MSIANSSPVCPNDCVANLCDESLVAAAVGGQHSAYAELCRRHSKRTFRTVHRITRNLEDAEYAVQDSLMKVYVHIGSFDGRSAFSSWLARIAINSALMMLRKKRNNPESSLELVMETGQHLRLDITERSRNPEDEYLVRESNRALTHAIGRLTPNLRGVMEIRQTNDARIEEIAERLGISEAAPSLGS